VIVQQPERLCTYTLEVAFDHMRRMCANVTSECTHGKCEGVRAWRRAAEACARGRVARGSGVDLEAEACEGMRGRHATLYEAGVKGGKVG
jgi:hypothetical protein